MDPRLADGLLVALIAIAFLIPGVIQLTGAPRRLDLAIDGAQLVAVAYLAWLAVRAGRLIIPYVALGYLLLVLAGLATEAGPVATLASLRNFTLLPALALLLSSQPLGERPARLVGLSLLLLCGFEFLVTAGQALGPGDTDLIVGTFGPYANWVTGLVIPMASCLAIARYLQRARGSAGYLPLAAILPLFTIWTFVKADLLIVPAAVLTMLAVHVGVSACRRVALRRSVPAAAAMLASAVAIGAGYQIQDPASLSVFFNSSARSKYLNSAEIFDKPPKRQPSRRSLASRTGAGKRETSGRQARRRSGATPPVDTARPVPGRLTQYRMAAQAIDGGIGTFLLGRGLGVATSAENFGVKASEQSPEIEAASFTDFGTLLVERGWIGVALSVLIAVSLGLAAAIALGRAGPGRSWHGALLLSYPGVLCVMVAGALYANPFRNPATATAFWILTGLVLAAISSPRDTASRELGHHTA